jgi:CheY-like chemotaxis protein
LLLLAGGWSRKMESSSEEPMRLMSRPMSLMLVDDNPTFLRILRRFLEEAKVPNLTVVATAGDGREALDIASAVRPTLMVVDLLMPDLHGPDLIHSLRGMLPGTGIIALTMLGAEVYRQAALAAGADDCVTRADLEHDLLPALLRVAQTRSTASDSVSLPTGSADAAPGGSQHCHRVNGPGAVPTARPANASPIGRSFGGEPGDSARRRTDHGTPGFS